MPRNPNAERDNPCLREQELSFKCLNKYNYDRDKCEVYFANYNNCKDFWVFIKQKSKKRKYNILQTFFRIKYVLTVEQKELRPTYPQWKSVQISSPNI